MSRRNPPGELQTGRLFPESEVAEMLPRPLDQTSSPRGDQASPAMANGPFNRTLPLASTTFTLPLLSPRSGWSMKATSFPSGETRTSLVQPGASYSTFPIGYSMRLRFPTSRATARLFPSGDQSASSTFSRTSRGAPPASGTRASVPTVSKPNRGRRLREMRQLPAGGDREDARARERQRARFRAVGPRREDVEGEPFPGGGSRRSSGRRERTARTRWRRARRSAA